MKAIAFLCSCLVVASPFAGLASEQSNNKPKQKVTAPQDEAAKKAKKQTKRAQKEAGVEMTGSHLKQDIRRSGRITDGPAQVVVIDRDAIERSGAADLRQVLSLSGVR